MESLEDFARAVAERWDEVNAAVPEEARRSLTRLVSDSRAEQDPVEVWTEIRELLFLALPPDGELWHLLFGTAATRRTGAPDVSPEDLAALLARLQTGSTNALHQPAQHGTENPARHIPADSSADNPLHLQVMTRLAHLDSLPDDGRDGPLVRLPFQPDDVRIPVFQIAPTGQPYDVVLEVNRLLLAETDPWGVACWWIDADEGLTRPPAELITSQPARLLAAARATADPVGGEY
jgi:hypothetical protein